MSWQVPKLRHRLQIRQPVQTATDDGGLEQTYNTLLTVWAGIRETSQNSLKAFVQAVRGEQTNERETHEFIVRYESVKGLGTAFSTAFSTAFDSQADINPVKSDYFLFLQNGSTVKGRLFRVMSVSRDDDRKEFLKMRAMEIEEHGTGWPE